ncbi:MAG: hypothetical protein NUV47_03470 [Patescibacteria group bacterium]|nr:hypothetical protein [Patescibacteria group bacterium]
MYTQREVTNEMDCVYFKDFISEENINPLAKALSYLPENIVDFVIEKCVFISLDKKDRGEYIARNDFRLKGKRGLIILSNSLWSKSEKRIAFAIAHEVAHVYKRHGFRRIEDTEDGVLNTKMERDADNQAILWLKPYFPGSFKRYLYKDWQLRPSTIN